MLTSHQYVTSMYLSQFSALLPNINGCDMMGVRKHGVFWEYLGINYKVKKAQTPTPKIPTFIRIKIVIAINVHEKMKLFTYNEVHHNIQHIPF